MRPTRAALVRLGTAALVPIAAAGGWGCWQVMSDLLSRRSSAAIDYRIYRAVAEIGVTRGWHAIYDETLQRRALIGLWAGGGAPDWWHSTEPFWAPFVSPPPVAWLATPFGALPAATASALWIAGLGVALGASTLLIARRSAASRFRYLVLLVVTWAPALALASANIVVLMVLGFVLCWLLLRSGHELAAGAVLGASTLKPQVLFVVPVLLLVVGHRRAVAAWAGTAAVLALVCVATLGREGIVQYYQLARYVSTFPGEQSLSVVRLPGSEIGTVVLAVGVGAALLAAAVVLRARDPGVPIAIGIVGSLLLAPYLNLEDYVLLVPAAMVLLRTAPGPIHSFLAVALLVSATPATQGFMVPSAIIFGIVLAALVASELLRRGERAREPQPAAVLTRS